MGFIKALLLLLVIPAFGIGVGQWALSDINQGLEAQGIDYSVSELCTADNIARAPEITPMCDYASPILLMQKAAIVTAVAAIALLLSFIIAASVAGKSRVKITKIFPPLVFISLMALAVIVLVLRRDPHLRRVHSGGLSHRTSPLLPDRCHRGWRLVWGCDAYQSVV